jgi:hypothetical protein
MSCQVQRFVFDFGNHTNCHTGKVISSLGFGFVPFIKNADCSQSLFLSLLDI